MQNGRRSTTDEKLDEALENTFPSSDPVSISRPDTQNGSPEQHGRTAARPVKETARKPPARSGTAPGRSRTAPRTSFRN